MKFYVSALVGVIIEVRRKRVKQDPFPVGEVDLSSP